MGASWRVAVAHEALKARERPIRHDAAGLDIDDVVKPQGNGPRIPTPMLNFILGTVAGGLIACVLTIAASRHPEIQARLGLAHAPVPATLAAVTKPPEVDCGRRTEPAPKVGSQDMLFNRQRFWSVAP
ncbi:hypothetical protein ACRBEV_08805 [Methylobacterium phyllosphaerae]